MHADAVPYLAAWRYKDSGLRKRAVVGDDLGSAAPRGRRRGRRQDPGPTEVRVGRLPLHHDLEAARQARRPQGTLHLLPRPRTRHRHHPGVSAGPAGTTSNRPKALTALYNHRRHQRGLDRRATHPDPGRARRARPLAAAVAQRARPHHRPGPRRLLRRLPRRPRPTATASPPPTSPPGDHPPRPDDADQEEAPA